MKLRLGLIVALAAAVALAVVPAAQAAISSVYDGGLTCTTEVAHGNVRACRGTTKTWDGTTKIDVNVFLPPEPASGPDGPYPTIGDFHGWGAAKQGFTNETITVYEGVPVLKQQEDPRIQHWAEEGYAVFSMSDRGWGNSCGNFDAAKGTAECAKGYNHLMDDRYEVRDAQYLLGELADEGVIEPKKIGVTGASYGGGMSIALGALRNRTMLPTGELVPWTSPEEGDEMEIAAAAPQWPWSDLSYALAPNGRNLDYATNSSYLGPNGTNPIGVMKYSWDKYLFEAGKLLSNYSKTDPEANIEGWIQRLEAGDPYSDSTIAGIIKELSTFHSAFGIDPSVEPSPMLIQSGWNDDLFPVDEALRYYQRTRAQYPGDPISLYLADIGHARSQNRPADIAAFNAKLEAWFAHYLKGEGTSPSSSVEALTTVCPESTAPEGPFRASDWAGLAPGEINYKSSGSQTLEHGTAEQESTPTETAEIFDPIVGPKFFHSTVCSSVSAEDQPRTLNYRLAPAPAGGYTLMGSPTIIATVQTPSPNSEIAARLLDEAPDGTQTLIARGLYRPDAGSSNIVFQLHPQAYHYAAGHVAKLELLPNDLPYGRFSNLQTNVTVSNLELRLPVAEQPGVLGGLVQKPAPKVLPPGYNLAAEYAETPSGGGGGGGGTTPPPAPKPAPAPVLIGAGGFAGKFSSDGKAIVVPVKCSGGGACSGQVTVRTKKAGGKGLLTLATGRYSVAQGKTANVRLPLTKAGRKFVKSQLAGGKKKLAGVVMLRDSGRPMLTLNRPVQLKAGN
jgi:predicted acyl esterase